jgi:acyl-CoA thioester hydrolase
MPSLVWDLPQAFSIELTVERDAIDAYGHVNNAVYLQWLDRTAWMHSAALGVSLETCLALDRGMAVVRTVIRYERPAFLGDAIACGTWITASDGKLRVSRRFQICRMSDGSTLARAEIDYVCLQLSTGKPTRFPREFIGKYAELPDLTPHVQALVPL